MDNLDIPEYFICPISLTIMKDPVTTISGITYDRASIQRWLSITPKCPVTMQPLSSDLIIPNTTVLRLIHSWCSDNGVAVDPIPSTPPTPRSPTRLHVANLIEDLHGHDPNAKIKTLQKLEALASESNRNRIMLCDSDDLTSSLVCFIVKCYESRSTRGLGEALSLFYLVGARFFEPLTENTKIIESLLWVLSDHAVLKMKPYAAHFLRVVIERASPRTLDGLKPEFFQIIFTNLRPENQSSRQGTVSLLNILLDTCPSRRNRDIMLELGAVSELVDVEMKGGDEKETTELVLGILCYLCSSAEGRAQLVGHPSGISVVTRRILKVSPMADDSAVFITWLVSRYLGTSSVLREMVRVGTVAKLCMVMQADCNERLKEKAKDILRAHSDVWKGPGIVVTLGHSSDGINR